MKDPNAPRKPPTAYFLFVGDTRGRVVWDNPSARVTEVSRLLAAAWAAAPLETKRQYEARAQAGFANYAAALAAYRAAAAPP